MLWHQSQRLSCLGGFGRGAFVFLFMYFFYFSIPVLDFLRWKCLVEYNESEVSEQTCLRVWEISCCMEKVELSVGLTSLHSFRALAAGDMRMYYKQAGLTSSLEASGRACLLWMRVLNTYCTRQRCPRRRFTPKSTAWIMCFTPNLNGLHTVAARISYAVHLHP